MAPRHVHSSYARDAERRDSTFEPETQDDTTDVSSDADPPLDTQPATAESHTESHAEDEAEAEDETEDDHENQQLSHEVSPIDSAFWDPNQITNQDFDASECKLLKSYIPPFNGTSRNANARFFLRAFQQSLTTLADILMRCDPVSNDPLQMTQEDLEKYMRMRILDILMSISWDVIQALMLGNLCRAARVNSTVCSELQRLYNKVNSAEEDNTLPFIYYLAIADDDGRAPSPNSVNDLLVTLRMYVKEDPDAGDVEMIHNIDTWMATGTDRPNDLGQTESGYRRYLGPEGAQSGYDRDRKNARVSSLKKFIDALAKRIDNTTSPSDEPMDAALCYIGFSTNVASRFSHHRTHVLSSWLLNLVHATFGILFGGRYILHEYVVFVLWQMHQAELAEVTFTRLCQAYTDDGGGCVNFPPGRSNKGREKIDGQQAEFDLKAYRDIHSPYQRQKDWELKLVRGRSDAEKRQREEDDKVMESIKTRFDTASLRFGARMARAALDPVRLMSPHHGLSTLDLLRGMITWEENKQAILRAYHQEAPTQREFALYSRLWMERNMVEDVSSTVTDTQSASFPPGFTQTGS
ncbi:MAG: hypothetical protein M1831_000747 [Alyxoria varia]|nr:MAG: hypothetical protein M1831_000747 [Alyxoria varia]